MNKFLSTNHINAYIFTLQQNKEGESFKRYYISFNMLIIMISGYQRTPY